MGMKMRKIFLFLVISVLCFQLISATETNIHIKTVPFMNVNVLVQSASFELYQRFNADADKYGDVSFIFSSDKTEFGLNVYVKDLSDNSKVASEEIKNLNAGHDVSLEVVPEGFNIIETPGEENIPTENLTSANNSANDSSNESLLTASEQSQGQPDIHGQVVFGENSSLKKIIIYVVGAIVLALIIFFIIKMIKKRKGEIKITKLSDWKEEQKDSTPGQYYGVLEDTQKKLEETQRELSAVKNQERIKETEEKLRRDAQELRSLRGF